MPWTLWMCFVCAMATECQDFHFSANVNRQELSHLRGVASGVHQKKKKKKDENGDILQQSHTQSTSTAPKALSRYTYLGSTTSPVTLSSVPPRGSLGPSPSRPLGGTPVGPGGGMPLRMGARGSGMGTVQKGGKDGNRVINRVSITTGSMMTT